MICFLFLSPICSLAETSELSFRSRLSRQALEALCKKNFSNLLEVSIALFDPRHMRVVTYGAGIREGLVWASSEAGQGHSIRAHSEALERKHLREDTDIFTNNEPIYLAAGDLILIPSAAFSGRGNRSFSDGMRVLYDTAKAHLGDEPLRLVTLAKNAFWTEFNKREGDEPPSGDLRLAAIRAVPSALKTDLQTPMQSVSFASKKFEVAALLTPDSQVKWLDLHSERKTLVVLAGASGENALEVASNAILKVLDSTGGDNDNPRQAGRDALAALGIPPRALTVIQVFDAYERVKYFRFNLKQPLLLGARGRSRDSMQQFDEGGEATVNAGMRLWFPGALSYDGQHANAQSLSAVWNQGKASRLYEALLMHWKIKKTPLALKTLALSAISDDHSASLDSFILVSGLGL